jgi:L-aspartate oxidase
VTTPVIRPLPGLGDALTRPAFDATAAVVVVGTGVAGLAAALEAAGGGLDVLVVSKDGIGGGSTPWAQGGLAAALDASDDPALHAEDTLTAGVGLNDDAAVDVLTRAAPGAISWLSALGAQWDPGPLGLEGGHSRHRIVHAGGDASGAEVHRVLAAAVAAAASGVPAAGVPASGVQASGVQASGVTAAGVAAAAGTAGRLRFLTHTVALDLVLDAAGRVAGALVGRVGADGVLTVGLVRTAAVVLATGGFGHAFATTTNPAGVTGDGLALAARAGAEVRDVEFVQFHPTVLWGPDGRGRRPLVTEALRGAGATLVDRDGRSVMAGAHPLGDLAPRDVVAATMQRRMASGDGPGTHLWLDATDVGAELLAEEFPTVTAACLAAGIDPAVEPIPVAPGAHYACGGVRADMNGVTSIDGLYAVGEVASTGVQGANRLASNSLTEGLIAGRRVGRLLAADGTVRAPGAPVWTPSAVTTAPTPGGQGAPTSGVIILETPDASGSVAAGRVGSVGVDPAVRDRLADAMSAHAGVERHGEGLEHLADLLATAPPAGPGPLDLETVEATNLHTVSTLVASAALSRTESRGCHRRRDFPDPSPAWRHHTVMTVTGRTVVLGAGGRIDDTVGARS